MTTMHLLALPAFADNYIWLLHDDDQTIVVDPGDAAPVTAAPDALGLVLAVILVTHHHPDHVGGAAALRPRLQGTGPQVGSPARETLPQPCTPLIDGDTVELMGCSSRSSTCPATSPTFCPPAPAASRSCFAATRCSPAAAAACSKARRRRYTGRWAGWPHCPATPGCAARRRTTSPSCALLRPSSPASSDLAVYTAHCRALRAQGRPTLPSTIAQERAINPFMRCDNAAVIAAAQHRGAADRSGASVLGALREWKNPF